MSDQSANEPLTFGGSVAHLDEGFGGIARQLKEKPDLVRHLSDKTLLMADAWAEGEDAIISAECKRRLAEYEDRRAKFAAFAGDPLAIIEDLGDDALWALARKILASRKS